MIAINPPFWIHPRPVRLVNRQCPHVGHLNAARRPGDNWEAGECSALEVCVVEVRALLE